MKNVSAYFKNIFIFAFIFIFASSVLSANYTTYQAKIVKPDGYPLEASNVNFKFTILDPSGSCILYSENYSSINMSGTGGMISFSLGSGVKTYPASSPTFVDIFNNGAASLSCDAGGPGNYSPGSNDTRKIVMQFHDGTGWQTLPAMTINAVPYAMYANDAKTLAGVSATSYVRYSTIPSCGTSEALHYNGVGFNCVALPNVGSFSAGDVASALSYTPANAASVTSLSSDLGNVSNTVSTVSSTVYAVSSTVNSLASNFSSFQNTVAASFATITSSQWTTSGSAIFYNGNVGVGTNNPATKLDVAGGLRISMEAGSCAADLAGTLRYNSGTVEYCNGTSWLPFGVAGAGITNINGSTSGAQTFATGITGTVVNISSANGVHTFNIPLAASSSVTAGLLSNADYLTFTNKLNATSAAVISALGYTPADNAASSTYVVKTNNLSDLTSSATARTNLGLGTLSTLNYLDLGSALASGTLSVTSLPSVGAGIVSGTQYTKVTVDGKGRVVSGAQLSSLDVTNALGFTPANNAASGSYVVKANNLSDLTSATVARANLGVGYIGTLTSVDLSTADVTGTLAIARTPAYTGDVTKAAASNTLVLSNTGVTAGTYTKVTVDAKGRVTSSSLLTASDVNTALGYTAANSATVAAITSSQWTTSGSTISYNTGNVGVGTSNPDSRLHVAGRTKISSVYPEIWFDESDTSGQGKVWRQVLDNKNLRFDIDVDGDGDLSPYVTPFQLNSNGTAHFSGNVGFGITTPSAFLHIKAGTSQAAPLKISSGVLLTSPQSGTIEYDGTNYYITDGSNVRRTIATVTSSGTLDGASVINNSSGNIVMTPNSSVVVSSTTASTNSQTGALIVNGGVGVAGNINASGAITTSSNIQGASITATSGMISPYIAGSVLTAGTLTLDSTTHATKGKILLAPNGGNVAIGTTAANANSLLTVAGATPEATIASQSTNTISLFGSGNAYFQGRDVTNDIEYVMGTSTASEVFAGSMSAHDFSLRTGNATRMYLKHSNGFVGVGTTNPLAKLHVAANSTTSESVAIAFYPTVNASTTLANYGIGMGPTATEGYMAYRSGIGNSNLYGHKFFVNDVERMRINGLGYVGIGNDNPGGMLEIGTNSGSSAAFRFVPSSDQSAVRFTTNSSANWIQSGLDFTNDSKKDLRFSSIGAATTWMTIQGSTGNVGIGTAAPTQKLDVNGGIRSIYGEPTASNTNAAGLSFDGDTGVFAAGDGQLNFWSNNNRTMSVYQGKVGIGTSAPTQALDVSGTAKATAFIGDGSGLTNISAANLTFYNYPSGYAGGAVSFAGMVQGVTGFHDYTGTATSQGTTYWAGLTTKNSNTGAQFAVNWDTNAGSPSGFKVRAKDDNQADWTSWRDVAFIDATVKKSGDTMTGPLVLPSNGLTVGTSQLVVSGGNVGIGTAAPGYPLHITGNLRLDGNIYGGGNAAGTPSGETNGMWVYGSSYPDFGMYYTEGSPDKISISPNGGGTSNPVMTVMGSGYVGIGTSAPAMALNIVGTGGGNDDVVIDSYGTAEATVMLRRARGTVASPTTVLANDRLGFYTFRGYNGTTFNDLSRIQASAETTLNVSENSNLQFFTTYNGSNTEKVRITASGAVGVGTIPPSAGYMLDVDGDVLIGGGGAAQTLRFRTTNTDGGFIRFNSTADSAGNSSLEIGTTDNSDEPIIFTQTANERMRIHTNGYVGIGTAAPQRLLHVNGDTYMNAITGGQLNGSGNFHIDAWSAGADRSVYLNWNSGTGGAKVGNGSSAYGPIAASAFNVSSDRRLKENIKPITNPLEKILKIDAVTFTWKDATRNKMEGERIGLIAQNVEKTFPQAVKKDHGENTLPGGTRLVNYPDLVSPIIAAIKEFYALWSSDSKELHKTIEEQKREMASIKEEKAQQSQEIEMLKNKSSQLEEQNKALKDYLCEKDPSAKICK